MSFSFSAYRSGSMAYIHSTFFRSNHRIEGGLKMVKELVIDHKDVMNSNILNLLQACSPLVK